VPTTVFQSKTAFEALRGFTLGRRPTERCDICAVSLAADHAHLYEPKDGRLLCACAACSILFLHRAGEAKYVRVPQRASQLTDFHMTDAEWNALRLPIDMAFFQHKLQVGRVLAYYPSPAGCTESLLELTHWSDIVRRNPELESLLPDVETLLVNRTRGRRDYYIAPIDQCYKLAGLIRLHWRGLSGGELVWQKIEKFFENLSTRACPS
jgi:Family of unknown function (DUF5947)